MADSPEVRIGTVEREQALNLLGEHFGAGRLTLVEFDERSAKAAAATTRAELDALFTDLPPATPNTPAAVDDTAKAEQRERWRTAAMGLIPLIALLLFFVFDNWLWFLLIPAAGILYSATKGTKGGC
ncbi:membrane protein [Rhodococcus rhodochrous]|nr:membrane protein [Rhodococcus rhodochrous]